MIADNYKVRPPTYLKIFQCYNGSEFKGEVTKILQKHEVHIRCLMTKYRNTHTAFVKALNKIDPCRAIKVQDAQELNDTERVLLTWVKHLYGLVDHLNNTKTQMTGVSLKDAVKLKNIS